MLDHDHYMGLALELARKSAAEGNRPLGSLLVAADGTVLAQGGNRVYTDFDPTSHGEMNVIRETCARLKRTDLSGTTVYTTLEPCPMCCWAIIESKVATVVLGARHAEIGRTDVGGYTVESFQKLVGRSFELVTGVKAKECVEMRLAWVAERARRGLGPR